MLEVNSAEVVSRSTVTLLEYGVLGVVLIAMMFGLVYMFKSFLKAQMNAQISEKDKLLKIISDQAKQLEKDKESTQTNLTKLLALYEVQSRILESLPDTTAMKVVEKLKNR